MSLTSDYLEYVQPLKGSSHYHRWSILSVVSSLLERRVWLDRGRLGVLFPNTYTILVGGPATGKSTAAGLAVELINSVRAKNRLPPYIGPSKVTQAALYEDFLKATRGVLSHTSDGETKQSPMFIYASELAVSMNDFGGGTLTNELIDFYDSKGIDITIQKKTISGGLLSIPNPSITLLAGTTPEYLQGASADQIINSGLASRIVFVVERTHPDKEWSPVPVDLRLKQSIINQLSKVYCMSGKMSLSPAAQAFYVENAKTADKAGFGSRTSFHQNYFGRKPDHICKLSMAFAAQRGSFTIEPEDLATAIEWLEEIEPDMIRAFGSRAINKDTDLAKQLIQYIPDAPGEIEKGDMLVKLMLDGKFLPLNGDFEATLKGMVESDVVKKKGLNGSTKEFYSRTKRAKALYE